MECVIPQLVFNALFASAGYTLVGIGFALIYRISGFFHLSHGAIYTLGAYAAWSSSGKVPWPLAVLVGGGVSALFGGLLFNTIYAPLRKRRVSPAVLMIVSLAVYVVLQNSISIAYGDEMQAMPALSWNRSIPILGARITFLQFLIICITVILLPFLHAMLRFTKVGLLVRAVASDAQLSLVHGVAAVQIEGLILLIGSALAGLAGALIATDTNLFPVMGLRAMLMAVTVVLVAGDRGISGIPAAAFLVAIAQQIGAWFTSARWQDAIAFSILILYLVLKPRGVINLAAK